MSKLSSLIDKQKAYDKGQFTDSEHSDKAHAGLMLINNFTDQRPIDLEFMSIGFDFEDCGKGIYRANFYSPDGESIWVYVKFGFGNELESVSVNRIPAVPTPRTRGALWWLMYSLATGRAD